MDSRICPQAVLLPLSFWSFAKKRCYCRETADIPNEIISNHKTTCDNRFMCTSSHLTPSAAQLNNNFVALLIGCLYLLIPDFIAANKGWHIHSFCSRHHPPPVNLALSAVLQCFFNCRDLVPVFYSPSVSCTMTHRLGLVFSYYFQYVL